MLTIVENFFQAGKLIFLIYFLLTRMMVLGLIPTSKEKRFLPFLSNQYTSPFVAQSKASLIYTSCVD